MMKVGDAVETSYGKGTLVGYKEVSNVYVVDLPFGKLYANKETIRSPQENTAASKHKTRRAMEINDAYESLEKMRRLNLEVTCEELGVSCNPNHDQCVMCLMAEADPTEETGRAKKDKRFPRIRKKLKSKKARKIGRASCRERC